MTTYSGLSRSLCEYIGTGLIMLAFCGVFGFVAWVLG